MNGGITISFEKLKNYSNTHYSSNKKKVGILIGGKTNLYSASSYIRILSPLNELISDFQINIIDNETYCRFVEDLNKNKLLDIIIIQRDIIDRAKITLNELKILFKQLKTNNTKIIFDIDDDLLNIDKEHVDYERYHKLKKTLEFLISNSDLITVSTKYLKQQLSEYNDNIIIIPNTLMKLWEYNASKSINNLKLKEKIRIGYFGTRSHKQDLLIIENAILNVKKYFKKKEIIIETVGVCYENYNWIKQINLPNNYKTNPNTKDHIKNILQCILNKFNIMPASLPYCNFIKWIKNETEWDIGIAPLEDNNINRSKSNLKYLEYTALNIPCIYSNTGPYTEIGEKNAGIVVNNTTKEWEKALINLIKNYELYETILKNAHKDVKKNYMVKNASLIWKQILIN